MLRARFTAYVTVPHLTTLVLDTDDAILEAYITHPRKVSRSVALRQARAGGVRHVWTVWDGDQPTDIRMTSEHWCEQKIKQMNELARADADRVT